MVWAGGPAFRWQTTQWVPHPSRLFAKVGGRLNAPWASSFTPRVRETKSSPNPHHEAVVLASLSNTESNTVAAPCGTQERQAAITRTRDKVQVIGAVGSMQAARHDKHYAISSIAAHPCKKRKDGAPAF